MTECLCALKESMIYNFLILDFYQEVNNYVNVNLYKVSADGTTTMSRDLDEVRRIIDHNNLSQVNYADTDMFERVRDECGEYLKLLEMNQLEAGCVDLTKRIETDA